MAASFLACEHGYLWKYLIRILMYKHKFVWPYFKQIDLIFPALVLGYKSLNCSMCHVPVPMLIEKFVWIYFKQLFTVAGSISFWHTNSRGLQSKLIPTYFSKFVWLSFKQLVCITGSIIFGIRTWLPSKVSYMDSYVQTQICMTIF